MRQFLLLIASLLCASATFSQCSAPSLAMTCAAGSTSAQVQAALSGAPDGAILTIGAGTYTATATVGGVAWAFSNTTGVTIICATPPTLANGATQDPTPVTAMGFHNKLVGAASINPCVLNLGASLTGGAIGMTTASGTNSHFYRVSGMTIDCNSFSTPGTGGLIVFSVSNGSSATMIGPGPAFNGGIRIDHNTFRNCPSIPTVTQNILIGDTSVNTLNISGVVDHNYFTGANFQTIVEWAGGRPATFSGSGIGTMNNLFFEDNFANFASMTNQSAEGCSDGQWGDTHLVFRFNHTIDCTYAMHAPVPSYMHYWNLVELDVNATGQSPVNCTRCLHHQGTGEFIVFSDIFKIPNGNSEAGDPIVNQDYRQNAGSKTNGVNAWSQPSSFTVTGGFTNIVVAAMSGGVCPGFGRFCFYTTRGFTNSANNGPFNPYDAPANRTTSTSGWMASLTGQVTETVTNGVIGVDDNGEMYPCDGTVSGAPVGYVTNVHTTITDGNRAPSATWFGYPCAMQPGRTMPAIGTAGTYSPNAFVGNTWFNTGDAAHGLAEKNVSGTQAVPNAFPPTNCGTVATLGVTCDYWALHMQANREWFVNFGTAQTTPTSPWDGTFTLNAGYGAGYGTLANRPTTCTTSTESGAGGMYLATDQGPVGADGVTHIGILYTCSATNTWTTYFDSGRQPYPHPLVGTSPQVATPTFSPAAGSYLNAQVVAISSTTGGATICYTNDGTVPTANGAGVCVHGTTLTNGGTVTVAFTQLLQAVGSEAGFTDSAVGSAQYTFPTAPIPTSVAGLAGGVIMEGTVYLQ